MYETTEVNWDLLPTRKRYLSQELIISVYNLVDCNRLNSKGHISTLFNFCFAHSRKSINIALSRNPEESQTAGNNHLGRNCQLVGFPQETHQTLKFWYYFDWFVLHFSLSSLLIISHALAYPLSLFLTYRIQLPSNL